MPRYAAIRRLREAPERLADGWSEAKRPMLGSVLAAVACGVVYTYVDRATPAGPVSPGLLVLGTVAMIGFAFAAVVFAISIALVGFNLFYEEPDSPGLDTVMEQRVHDTGGMAQEALVDAALRDEDQGQIVVPRFKD